MNLEQAILNGYQSWGHYTAWQIVMRNFKRMKTQNQRLKQELAAYKKHSR